MERERERERECVFSCLTCYSKMDSSVFGTECLNSVDEMFLRGKQMKVIVWHGN
jgi:hypothetical protein